jgi:hypothetical protein
MDNKQIFHQFVVAIIILKVELSTMDCRQLLYGDCNRLAFNCKQGLGMGFLTALSVGIFSVAWWPALPDLCWYVVLICLLSVVVGYCPWSSRLKSVAMLLVISGWGSLWGLWSAYDLLDHQLPVELQGQDLLVTGTVIGLVDRDERRSRFSFAINSRDKRQGQPDLRLLLLSWYDGQADNLVSGHRCDFIVRLRRPRGLLNSAGFDYQSWLLQQGYSAVGSVRSLEQDCVSSSGFGARLGRLRSSIQGSINAADMTNNGSKTSSTADFVTMFEPENVIFSAGYRHYFGHPHAQVVKRYQAAGSRIWSTAEHGAISFVWDQLGRAKVVSATRDGWRFWWR